MAPKKKKSGVQTLDERVEVRMSPKDKQVFQEAATRQNISLSLWLRLAGWRVINEHQGRVSLIDTDV